MSGVIEKFQLLQSKGDVLSTTRLARAGLIEESLPSSSGADSRMAVWFCWGTLPLLVLWGASIICTNSFCFFFYDHILFFLMRLFASDDYNVHFSDPSLCLTFFFVCLMFDRYGPFR